MMRPSRVAAKAAGSACQDILSVNTIVNKVARQPLKSVASYAFVSPYGEHAFTVFKHSNSKVYLTDQNFGSEGVLLEEIKQALHKKKMDSEFVDTSLADYEQKLRITPYACNRYASWAQRNVRKWVPVI